MAKNPKRRLKPGWHAQHKFKATAVSVTAGQLRQIFSDAGILQQVKKGELTEEVDPTSDKHPSPPRADEPICTRSQIVIYKTLDGQKIATAHRFLREDGSIGASGFPDPKEIIQKGILHYLDVT